MPTSALFANALDWKRPTPHVRGRDGWVPATRRVTTEPHGGTCYCCTTWVDPRVAAPRGGASVLVGGSVWRTRAKVTAVGTWSDQDGQQKGWGDLRAAGSSCGAPGVDGAVLCGGLSSPPAPSRPHSQHTHPWVHDLARTAASSAPTRLAVLKGPRCEHNCVSVLGPVTRWSRRCGGARAGGEGGAPVAGVALWSSFCLLHAKGQKCGRDTTDDKMYPISGA